MGLNLVSISAMLATPAWAMGGGYGRTVLAAKLILPLTIFQLALGEIYRRGARRRAVVVALAGVLGAGCLFLQVWNPIWRVLNGYTEASFLWMEVGVPAALFLGFVFLPIWKLLRSRGQQGVTLLVLALELNALVIYSASLGTLEVMPLPLAAAAGLAALWPKAISKLGRHRWVVVVLLVAVAARLAYLTWLGSRAVGFESPISLPGFYDIREVLAWGASPRDRFLYSIWFAWLVGNFLCAMVGLGRLVSNYLLPPHE